ncbi:hypothetical protein F4774DRAFT_420751 [Daldinia eschscholtzii]|nr:hypothetical protein F4774DRAFT_420751 [Daldinia eschscholtzii]
MCYDPPSQRQCCYQYFFTRADSENSQFPIGDLTASFVQIQNTRVKLNFINAVSVARQLSESGLKARLESLRLTMESSAIRQALNNPFKKGVLLKLSNGRAIPYRKWFKNEAYHVQEKRFVGWDDRRTIFFSRQPRKPYFRFGGGSRRGQSR